VSSDRPAHLFKPGQSGNPGGRSKGNLELRSLARQRTAEALATLINIMRNPKAASAARVSAAQAILDRGWGKAVQPTAFTDMEGEDRPFASEIATDIEKARRLAWILAQGLRAAKARDLPAQQEQLPIPQPIERERANPHSDLHSNDDSQVDSNTYPEESA
jgi:hypothetical protein